MDISGTTLTPVKWLNQQFQCQEARENSEAFTAKLLISLQHQMYKAQQGMDDVSSQILHLKATFSHDIPSIRTHSNYLINDISDLHNRLEVSSGVANTSLQKIRATEMVKQRIELTYRSLENQDNWEALLGNIKELIANGDLEAISSRLTSLQKCFVSLSDAVDHEKRQAQLEDIKNAVEGFLIPRLVSGLSVMVPWKSSTNLRNLAGSEGLVLKIMGIFDLMRRTDTLKRILQDYRQRQFIARWEDLLTSSQADTGSCAIDECAGNFYEDLSSSWHNQLPLFAAAYPDPTNALLQSYISLLSDLGPKLENELSASRQKSLQSANAAQDYLSALLSIRRSQEAFCGTIEKEYYQNHSRTPSAVDSLAAFAAAVRKPLENAVKSYIEVEKVVLSAEFARCHLTGSDKAKSIHTLLGSAMRLSSSFYSAIVRCFQLTDGRLLHLLVKDINTYIAEHANKVRAFATGLKTPALDAQGKSSDFTDADCEILSDIVKVLQNCGDLVLQLENIDDMLVQDNIHPDPVDQRLFASSIATVQGLANSIFQSTLTLLLRPVEVLLEGVPGLATWTSSATRGGLPDIPSFGFDPQEYITRIGNYLLTLPQIMDPVLSSESPSMKRLKTMLAFHGMTAPDESTSLTEAWIQATVHESMLIVTTVLTRTKHLTSVGIRQMTADAKYFQNVVEDFAVPLSDTFAALIDLLTCSHDDWLRKQETAPPVIVSFIRRARNFD